MRRGGSKNKGGEYERKLAKRLSLWWSAGEKDDLFWRTNASGGRFTIRKRQDKDTYGQAGDITSTSPESQLFSDIFCVEAKYYKDIDLWSIMTEVKGDCLYGFWKQAVFQAESCCKRPILIVKQNNKVELFICDYDTRDLLIDWFTVIPKISVSFYGDIKDMCIYPLSEFLNLDIVGFKEALRRINE